MKKNPLLAQLMKRLASSQEQMLRELRELVELESPSTDKSATDKLGVRLRAMFEALGGRVTVHPQARYGDHLQVEFAGGPGRPAMLLGHFDTVYELGTLASMPFQLEKGRAYGPGVYDMKAGIVMMMHAIRALREANDGALPRPVRIWLVTDEEVGSESSRETTERLARQSDAVFVLEPSQGSKGALKTARKGVGSYTVTVRGVASHSGVDFEKGQSAIVELAHQIMQIAGFTELKRGITVNPGVVRGGTRTNVIAAEATVEVDVRVSRMQDAARLEKRFRKLRTKNKKCKLEISGGVNRPPMERTKAVAGLYFQASDIAKQLGFKVEEKSTGGGSDGNFTAAAGVPTLDGLGAVGEGAHASHESISVGELPRRAALLAGLLAGIR
jgi:glutamate carboxypeptidase